MDVTWSPKTLNPLHALALACLLWSGIGVAAPSPDSIQSLLDQGDFQGALENSEQYLEANPDDARVRFQRGVALARLDRDEAAIEIFGELARDYPQAPEPANNLAVLYAAQGDFEKARRWLEAAMETHPAYATAHKNLGDVYTALAAAAYSKALDEQERAKLGVDLAYVQTMQTSVEDTTAVAAGESDSAAREAAPAQATKTTTATEEEKAEDGADRDGEMRVVPAPKPQPEPARAPQPEEASATDEQETAAPSADADKAGRVMAAVRAWARAWSAQDVDAYLDAYAANFYPGDGLNLAEWRAQRRDRVGAPASISVTVRRPEVSFPQPDRARVVFQQDYDSDTYSDSVQKTLVLERKEAGWKIVREISE